MGQTIKVSNKPAPVAPEVLPFHRAIFDACRTYQQRAQGFGKAVRALLVSRYGEPTLGKDKDGKETRSGGPDFAAYTADQKAFAHLARERKLTDNQWYRKCYAKAVRELYGALPVSMDAAAVAKRAQREAAEANKRAAEGNPPAPTAGALKGQTQDHAPNPAETLESLIARVGLFNAGFAIVRIMEADDSTKATAVHLRAMFEKAQNAYVAAHNPQALATKGRTVTRTVPATPSGRPLKGKDAQPAPMTA